MRSGVESSSSRMRDELSNHRSAFLTVRVASFVSSFKRSGICGQLMKASQFETILTLLRYGSGWNPVRGTCPSLLWFESHMRGSCQLLTEVAGSLPGTISSSSCGNRPPNITYIKVEKWRKTPTHLTKPSIYKNKNSFRFSIRI